MVPARWRPARGVRLEGCASRRGGLGRFASSYPRRRRRDLRDHPSGRTALVRTRRVQHGRGSPRCGIVERTHHGQPRLRPVHPGFLGRRRHHLRHHPGRPIDLAPAYGVATGRPVESAGSWAGPKEVGVGWDGLLKVFSGGDGIIYGVNTKGDLLWYNHLGHSEGHGLKDAGSWLGPKPVGVGWGSFATLFSSGNGVIYGIQPDVVLKWYRHLGYQTGAGLETAGSWEGGVDVGWGWRGFDTVFALLPRDPDPVH